MQRKISSRCRLTTNNFKMWDPTHLICIRNSQKDALSQNAF